MAEDGHFVKKRKTFDNKIFIEFLKEKDKYPDLKDVVQLISNGVGPLPFTACPLKIEAADASLCKTFSCAYCRVQNHRVNRENSSSPHDYMAISIGSLFKPGCATLLNFLEDETVPDDEQRFDAFKRLVTLFRRLRTKPDFKELLENTKEANPGFLERNWFTKMAHLLSELSPSKDYIIDHSYRVSKDDLPVYTQEGQASKVKDFCTCDQEELVGKYGDTSFGCKTLWHGKADLFLGIPLQFIGGAGDASTSVAADDQETVAGSLSSIGIEAKTANDFSMQDKYQMRAQAIVFGYLVQKEYKNENTASARYFLIPHLAFSKEKFCFHFFDSVNDVLLETNAFNLFQSGRLSNYFVVLAWLALNYKVFGGETPDSLLEYKSGFHNMFGEEVLKRYSQEVEHPCHVKSSLTAENLFLDLVTVKREDWQTEKIKFSGRSVYD